MRDASREPASALEPAADAPTRVDNGPAGSERWGIRGPGWRGIRAVRDRHAAYGWAHSFARPRQRGRLSIRRAGAPTTVYVDRGTGWQAVETVEPEAASHG